MSSTQRSRSDAPSWFVALVAVAGLVLVASIGAIVWLARDDSAAASTSTGDADLRGELVGIAEQFFVEANNYDLSTEEKVADYKRRLSPLMTDAETQRFEKQLDQAIEVLGLDQVKSKSTATVRQTAVETLDDDSAVVMVTGDAEFDSMRLKRTFFPRWEVALRLVDGEWLVENHTELGDSGIISTTPGGQ